MPKEEFMRLAIEQAKLAVKNGEYPFGAVIEKDGLVLAKSPTAVAATNDATCHAEVNVIREASKLIKSKNLTGCTIYTTCEPCPMCFAAAWCANVSTIVYGVELADVSNVSKEINVSCKYLNERGQSKVKIVESFLREECLKLYKSPK